MSIHGLTRTLRPTTILTHWLHRHFMAAPSHHPQAVPPTMAIDGHQRLPSITRLFGTSQSRTIYKTTNCTKSSRILMATHRRCCPSFRDTSSHAAPGHRWPPTTVGHFTCPVGRNWPVPSPVASMTTLVASARRPTASGRFVNAVTSRPPTLRDVDAGLWRPMATS